MADQPKSLDDAIAGLRAAVAKTPEARALSRFAAWLNGAAWRRWLIGATVLALVGAVRALGS